MSIATQPKIADRIATTLRRAIVAGQLRPGDALPSERELADEYDVNRSSIREAIRRLETWGLVKIRQGSATRVSDFFVSAGLDMVPHLFEVGADVDPGILRDLHELRALLLGWAAERAALQADPSSIARLDELARRLAEETGHAARLQELDYDFFQELVAISGNRLLMLFSSFVRRIYEMGQDRFAAIYAPGVFDAAHHQQVVDAIRRRDPVTAGDAMRAHAQTALRTVGGS